MKGTTTTLQSPFAQPTPVPHVLWGDVVFLGVLLLGAAMIVNFRRGA